MTELTTAHSFMVRIYRIDPQDPSRLTGQIELLDGSAKRMPFSGINELEAVLNHSAKKRRRPEKQELLAEPTKEAVWKDQDW